MSAGLVAKDLEYARDDRVLFSHLSFAIKPGEILQIEGRNGCGKTTLLRILCGLIRPDQGQIFWANQDIQQQSYDYLTQMTYVGHHDGLKADCTPLENLQLSLALSGNEQAMSAQQALEKVGLIGFDDQFCRSLSAGQRRRVALARLLINPSRLWILDEPFTAIDKGGVVELEQMIADHVSNGGMVMLTSHHDLKLINSHTKQLKLGART